MALACASTSKLSAADIVAKNIEARGGVEAWRKVQTMVWIGRLEGAHAPGPNVQFKLAQKRPNKTRLQVATLGDNSLRVFDGVQGWKLRMAHGRPDVQPYSPQEVRYAQAGHGIDGPLIDSAAKGTPVSLVGVEQLAERPVYHLTVQSKGGPEDVWVDRETFLEVRYDRFTDAPGGGQRRVSTRYADYHVVDGLQIAFVIETGTGSGITPDRMLLDKAVINAPLEDSLFENPTGQPFRKLPALPRGGIAAAPPAHGPQPAEDWLSQ